MDWSQVRPEWGLSQNLYFVIGRRHLTEQAELNGRAFLHSYDYRVDPKRRLLENILTGPLVVGACSILIALGPTVVPLRLAMAALTLLIGLALWHRHLKTRVCRLVE